MSSITSLITTRCTRIAGNLYRRKYPVQIYRRYPGTWTLSSQSRDYTSQSRDSPKAVIFDIGGVVVPSPFPLIGRFEKRHNIPEGSINETIRNYGTDGSFAKLERGELTLEQFCEPFSKEFSQYHGIQLSQEQVWDLARGLGGLDVALIPYKEVTDLMKKLKGAGLKVAVVTNNFKFDSGKTVLPTDNLESVDVFIQSCLVGIKKPDPAIYEKVLNELGVDGREAIFLDDIGNNLKAAAQLGITTIKVDDVISAIKQVEDMVFNKNTSQLPEGTTAVSDKLQLPVEPLIAYLKDTLGIWSETPPLIRSFQHGQSNPTYYLEYGGEKLVLRKKPTGKLLPSAHAVEREYRVMSAVGQFGVPVPPLLSLCEDESIIGTPFYLMKYVPGQVFKNPLLPHLKPSERKEAYSHMCQTLAAIHSVDINDAKLNDYGKHGDYVKRQINRWTKQYKASMTHDIPVMNQLINWLQDNIPENDTTTVVHGDFRIDNLIYGSKGVLAVLDWELSTLGDPYSDLAYCCMPYYRSPDNPALIGIQGLDYSSLGIPTEEEFLSQYCQLRGLSHVPHWSFYLSFSFFRVAAILQGVYKRSLQNQSSSSNASTVGKMAESYAQQGWALANKSHSPFKGAGSRRHYSTVSSSHTTGLLINDVSSFPPHLKDIREKLINFMNRHIFPNEKEIQNHQTSEDRWKSHPLIDELKIKAKSEGLWNLFLPIENDPNREYGGGLSNLEYAHLAEIMGQCVYASEVFNCSPPDTGNMEVLVRYGTNEQKAQWLHPLLDGKIRSCFAMTEPAVASSDATNIQSSIVADGNHYVLNGQKWWASGGVDPRCKICIFMGKTDPTAERHRQQSMILVPMETPGIHVVRPLTVFGYDDAPSGHAEILFDNVRVPKENLIYGEGRGFEIAQGRLGPGRIHHCMRLIGMCERALELMKERVDSRIAFKRKLNQFDTIISDIAQSRIDIDQARLLTLKAAHKMDTVGNKVARNDIAMIKVVAPRVAQQVIDRAMQAHGAKGLSEDTPLAQLFAWSRILRLADGPDEVHISAIGKYELKNNLSTKT